LCQSSGFPVRLHALCYENITDFHLPAFASDLNLSVTKSSLTLSLLNGASVVGRLVAGQLSDILDPWLLALSTLMGSCLSTFVLWGVLSHSFGGLVAFGLAYGSLAGGWSSLWTGFMKDLPRQYHFSIA